MTCKPPLTGTSEIASSAAVVRHQAARTSVANSSGQCHHHDSPGPPDCKVPRTKSPSDVRHSRCRSTVRAGRTGQASAPMATDKNLSLADSPCHLARAPAMSGILRRPIEERHGHNKAGSAHRSSSTFGANRDNDRKFMPDIATHDVQACRCRRLARYWLHLQNLQPPVQPTVTDAKNHGKQREQAVLGEKFPGILAHCLLGDQRSGWLGDVSNGHPPLIPGIRLWNRCRSDVASAPSA